MSQPLVSVIIPLYNRKHLISRCLKSVCEQSYKNLEIIVVDDGSTDNPDEVLQEWEKDARVKVLRKPNGGVSTARNMGIDAATGEFVQFVDSDDELMPGAIELSVKELQDSELSAVLFLDEECRHEPYANGKIVYQRNRDCVASLFKLHTPCSCIHKLYRREIMGQDVRFATHISWGEDFVFNINYFSRCRSLCRIMLPLYCVHRQEGSLTVRYDERGFDDAVAQYEAIADYLDKEHHPDVCSKVSYYLWLCWIECVRKLILLAPLTYGEKVSTLKKWMQSDFAKAMTSQHCPPTPDCYVLSKGWPHATYFAVRFCSVKSRMGRAIKKWFKAH